MEILFQSSVKCHDALRKSMVWLPSQPFQIQNCPKLAAIQGMRAQSALIFNLFLGIEEIHFPRALVQKQL